MMVSYLFLTFMLLVRVRSSVTAEALMMAIPSATTCEDRGSCAWVPGQDQTLSTNRNCLCDDLCALYGDCCTDYAPINTQNGTRPFLHPDTFSCVPLKEMNMSFYGVGGNGGVLMVDRCPLNYTQDDIRSLCEIRSSDTFLSVPVSDLRTNILYKNHFCAVCHARDMNHVKFWKIQRKCYNDSQVNKEIGEANVIDMLLLSNDHHCKQELVKPDDKISVRLCRRAIGNCLGDNAEKEVQNQCSNHTNYVYDGRTFYKNKFCALCNNVPESQISCNLDYLEGDPIADIGDMGTLSFRVLLDLNSGEVGVKFHEVNTTQVTVFKQCPEDHFYDPFMLKCRPYRCSPGQRLTEGGSACTATSENGIANAKNNLLCPKMVYNLSEVTNQNGSLIVNDEVYHPNEYEIDDDLVYVCVPTSMNNNYTILENVTTDQLVLNYSQIEGLVTTIGLSISLVCLVICIIMHSIFPDLRNMIGKCVLGLASSLFVGQLLFLTATRIPDHTTCYAMALILHYAFLASFCWTNCLSIDVCLAFSTRYHVAGHNTKRFIKYSLYAWGMPALLVVLAVLLDIIPGVEDSYRPHYGDTFCLINRSGALLVAFAAPIALIIAINLVLFVITTRNIYKAKKVAQFAKKQRRSGMLDFILYTKLYIIMGLTWLFGFLATTTNVDALWYLFIVLNTLQGAFLCLAFLLTKKTAKIIGGGRTSLLSSTSRSRRTYNSYLNKKHSHSNSSSV